MGLLTQLYVSNDIPFMSVVQETSFTDNTTEHDMSYSQCKLIKRKGINY